MRRSFIALLAGSIVLAVPALAVPPSASSRPEMRPTAVPIEAPVVTVSSQASTLAVRSSMRPVLRGVAVAVTDPPRASRVRSTGFSRWIEEFSARARAQGITQRTLDTAFSDVAFSQRVLDRDRNQSEFSRALWDYLDTAVSAARVRNGRENFAEYRDVLERIERRYRVDAQVVVAIWGLESAYGAMRGDTEIVSAMATLAYEGRRREFFEAQLLAALEILQAGDVRPGNMTGSWAGAMGHTQFMPTSYLEHAVDFTGDGRRNIWSDDPVDALASTANYLAENGWTLGQPWGMEVTLPDGFDYAQTGEQLKRSPDYWNRQGVRLVDGGRIPNHGEASILLPAGHTGVALVIFDNFHVIESYNPADAYVIAVGHLSDRITGGPTFRGSWPRGDRALTFDEREELQRQLTRLGFHEDGIDGIIGPETIDSVRRYQASIGWTPDGYASLRVLDHLR